MVTYRIGFQHRDGSVESLEHTDKTLGDILSTLERTGYDIFNIVLLEEIKPVPVKKKKESLFSKLLETLRSIGDLSTKIFT